MSERILLVCSSEPGHLHPFVGVLQALQRERATLAVVSIVDLRPRLERAGVQLEASYADAAGLPSGARAELRGAQLVTRLRNSGWTKRWYEMQLISPVPPLVEAVERAIDAFAPDALCVEGLFYAGAIAADRRRLPWASVATNLAPLTPPEWISPYGTAMAALESERGALATRYALPLSWCSGMSISPWLNLAFSTTAITPYEDRPDYPGHLVGASFPDAPRGDEPAFPWDRFESGRPLVLFSSGSILAFPPALIRALAEAVPDDHDAVFAIGDAIEDPALATLPPHVHAFRYVPQRALLRRASAFVTHAGMNGFLEALAAGCPMLALPLVYEQPLQARLVERLGVGVCIDDPTPTIDELRTALRQVTAPATVARARAVGDAFAAHDGAGEAAALLLKLARTRAPIPR